MGRKKKESQYSIEWAKPSKEDGIIWKHFIFGAIAMLVAIIMFLWFIGAV